MCNSRIDTCIESEEPRFELSKKKAASINTTYNLTGLFDKYVKEIYEDRKLSNDTNKQLFHSVYQPLKEGVKEGFGQVTTKIEYGTPNFEMLKNLQHNTGVFAMFKNHAMVKEIAGQLKDKDGNLKPFQQFKTDAKQIDSTYRDSWLKTEYDTAVRASRMAAQWERIQSTKHLYPCLEYVHTKAANPRIDHLDYVGIIRPVDDPFWSTNYPPNGWKCQCSVAQSDKQATDIPDGLPEVPPDFRFNSGKLGQVYSIKDSNYIKSVSAAEMPKLIKTAKTEVNRDIVKDLQYQNLYKPSNGRGSVDAHPMAFKNSDFNDVLSAARTLANSGKTVKILPDVSDPELRTQLLPTDNIKPGKNPDYLVGKDVFDLKTVKADSTRSIKSKLEDANKQCNNVVIDIPVEIKMPLDKVKSTVLDKLKMPEMKDFGKVWIRYHGKLYTDLFKSK